MPRQVRELFACEAMFGYPASLLRRWRVPKGEFEMSDQNEEQLSPEEQQLSPSIQAQLRQGRKAARDLEAATLLNAKREKMDVVVAAGVPNHPAREVVFENYDGPMDAENIKAYAEKYGIVAVQAENQGPSAEEIAAQRQILNAGGGAPAASGDVDLAIAMRNAKSKQELMGIIGEVVGQPGFKNRDGLVGVWPEPI
jgi:hypothetical protein